MFQDTNQKFKSLADFLFHRTLAYLKIILNMTYEQLNKGCLFLKNLNVSIKYFNQYRFLKFFINFQIPAKGI